ncbi:AraC family transcriptional regulator [Halarcobacter sp.]|uniref:AraC family transcriptional regulator n=1 Tax=Halarcobacter sp. TaxID=2321133 RepID=UPI003B0041D1
MDFINFSEYKSMKTLKGNQSIFAKYCYQEYNDNLSLYTDNYILSFILSGKKKIITQEKELEVKKGDLLFLKRGEYINSIVTSESPYTSLVIVFNTYLTSIILEDLNIKKDFCKIESSSFFLMKQSNLLKQNANIIKTLLDVNTKYIDEILKLKLKEIILLLLDSNYSKELIDFFYPYINNIKPLEAFMHENFDRPLNLESFAKESGRSLSSFKKDFKKFTSYSPMKWIQYKRLKRAKYLIEYNNCTVSEACFYSGFKDISHFSKLFKATFFYSPSQINK